MSTVSERVQMMINELQVDQTEFGKLCGASKSVVNQWLSGGIKSFAAEYAYALAKNTDYNPEWIQIGTGTKKKPEPHGDLTDLAVDIAKKVMLLPKEKQLEIKTWAAVEVEIRMAREGLAAIRPEQDLKTL